MKEGDLVKCDDWIHDGRYGIVIDVDAGDYCVSASILMSSKGVQRVAVENLRVINESW